MIRADLTPLSRALSAMARRAQRIEPVLEEAAPRLAAMQREHFAQGGVQGDPWAPLKEEPNRTPLVKTGALRDSISAQVEGNRIVLSADAPHAAFHQHGTRHIPARPFLVVNGSALRDVVGSILDHILEGEL